MQTPEEPPAPQSQTSSPHESAPHAGHEGHAAHDHYQHDFSDVEKYRERFESPERAAWQKPEEVIQLMQLSPGMATVDLGAGTGYFLPYLSKAVGESGSVLALDVEPNMVDYMSNRAQHEGLNNVTAQRVLPDNPQLETESVDRILIVDTWHHLPNREQYGRLLRDALRKNGQVVVVDFTKESPVGPPAHARLTEQQVVAELQASGMTATVLKEDLPRQYVVVGTK